MLCELQEVDVQSANCVQIWFMKRPSAETEDYVAVILRFLDSILQKA